MLTSDEAARQVRRAASTYLIKYEHLTPIVWTSVADIGVTLTIRFLTDPRRRRSAEAAIWEEILEDPAIFPPEEMLLDGTLEFFADLGDFAIYYADAYAAAKS